MKSLIIAEKPSVARDIASALGKVPKKDDYYENDDYVISSAVGHLVELFMPEDIDKKLSYWRMEPLPIIPDKFQVKPIEKTKDKFNQLKKLMKRKDVGEVINGCDAGREGELIFTYIYEAAGCKKPVKRLWMQSMTPEGIRQAFANLREDEKMHGLRDAARSRSEADWLIGINGTRVITKRMFGSARGRVATVGRVQTPTLTLVYEREQAIKNFKPRTYWRIRGDFGVTEGEYQGYYQKPGWKKNDDEHDRVDRLWDEEDAKAIVDAASKAETAEVSEEKKRSRSSAPRLYDLTSLQRDANNRYGMPAGITLRTAQSLYEKHKLLTYPRTDSQALPEDYVTVVKSTLGHQTGNLAKFAEKVLEKDWVKGGNKRIFNNAQVSDHFAIIPTNVSATGKKLSADEQKIYDLVSRRFIAAFYPNAEYDVTTRLSVVAEEHTFRTEGRVLVVPGWLEVYEKDQKSGSTLTPLSEKDGKPAQANVLGIEAEEDQTKPPPRYTEATLLSAMESAGKLVEDEELAAAMKEKGLGTPATRAQTIDHIIKEKYIERVGRELAPTVKAENLIEFLRAVNIRSLVSAELTGDWEYKLKLIEDGKLTRDEFMEGITEHARRVVRKAKDFDEDQLEKRETKIIAPSDKKPMMESLRTFKSQDGEITVYKTIGNRKLSEDEVQTLLNDRKIGPLDGFRSKAGKPFSAMLRINDETNKVEFVFDDAMGENGGDGDLNLDDLEVVGTSPVNGTKVYETPNAYADEKAVKGDKSGFRLSRTMLGKTLPAEQVKKLLTEKKTDLIEGFRSKRTKRLFSAHLILKDKGGIGFEFPPRAAKKKTAKKKTAKKKTAAKKSAE